MFALSFSPFRPLFPRPERHIRSTCLHMIFPLLYGSHSSLLIYIHPTEMLSSNPKHTHTTMPAVVYLHFHMQNGCYQKQVLNSKSLSGSAAVKCWVYIQTQRMLHSSLLLLLPKMLLAERWASGGQLG